MLSKLLCLENICNLTINVSEALRICVIRSRFMENHNIESELVTIFSVETQKAINGYLFFKTH